MSREPFISLVGGGARCPEWAGLGGSEGSQPKWGGLPLHAAPPPGGAVTVFICSLKCYLYCKENKKQADAPAALRVRGGPRGRQPRGRLSGSRPRALRGDLCRQAAAQQRGDTFPHRYICVSVQKRKPTHPGFFPTRD